MQKSTALKNTPCCVLISFSRDGFGDIWRICYIVPPL